MLKHSTTVSLILCDAAVRSLATLDPEVFEQRARNKQRSESTVNSGWFL